MKKQLFSFVYLLIPILCPAQTEARLFKDYFTNVLDMAAPLKVDDKIYILTANSDNNKVQVLAVDESLKKVWSTTVDGYAKNVFKFKGNILVVTKTDSMAKKPKALLMNYKAYLFDAVTGRVIVAKQLCKLSSLGNVVYFTGSSEGAFFKMIVRGYNPKDSSPQYADEGTDAGLSYAERQTKAITITDFDDNLKPASVFQPNIKPGVFLGLLCNNAGTLFLSAYNGGLINIQRYPQGKTQASATLDLPLNVYTAKPPTIIPLYQMMASILDPDVLYASAFCENQEKQNELSVYKVNFTTNTVLKTEETFTEDHIKALETQYKPINANATKLRELAPEMNIKFMIEQNERLVVSLASTYQISGYAGTDINHQLSFEGSSLLIKGFDLDVQPKYAQLLPSNYKSGVRDGEVYPSAHLLGKQLQIIDSYSTADNVMVGTLNTATGDWTDIQIFPKKKLGGQDIPIPGAILWFGKSFWVPYAHQSGLFKPSLNISFQQCSN